MNVAVALMAVALAAFGAGLAYVAWPLTARLPRWLVVALLFPTGFEFVVFYLGWLTHPQAMSLLTSALVLSFVLLEVWLRVRARKQSAGASSQGPG